MWRTRPNGDASEHAAWQQWLKTRYGAGGEDGRAAALRAWGAAPDEGTSLPSLDDFTDRNLFGALRPRKAADYKRFSQDMFTAWVRQMTDALRSNGNRAQLVTVGQDEGGLSERPNPLFFGKSVDFTCMHTWWNNDAQAWDAVLSALPDRPMLVEETGMMRYERVDGTPWRTEDEAARLLERKLAIAVGSGSSGYVQWIWNTNPFMASDNEAGIGFFRADGTARPELEPFVRLSRFLRTHADRLKGRQLEDVALLIPHSQMFSPRSLAIEATQRAVRVLAEPPPRAGARGRRVRAGRHPRRAAADHRPVAPRADRRRVAGADGGRRERLHAARDRHRRRGRTLAARRADEGAWPAGIVTPGRRPGARRDCRNDLSTRVSRRSAGAGRDGVRRRGIARRPFTGSCAARGRSSGCRCRWSSRIPPTRRSALYRAAIAAGRHQAAVVVEPADGSVYVGAITYADAVLVALASESSADQDVSVSLPGGVATRLRLPAGRAMLVLVDRKSGRVLGSDRD